MSTRTWLQLGLALATLSLPALSLPAAALAQESGPRPADDPLLTAVEAELARQLAELRLPGAPPIMTFDVAVREEQAISISASFGALINNQAQRHNPTRVEMRVGDASFSSGEPGASPYSGLAHLSLPIGAGEVALRRDLWLGSDAAYKGALGDFASRLAQLASLPEGYGQAGTFEAGPVVEWYRREELPALPREAWADVAREATALFQDVPGVLRASCHVIADNGHRYLVRSDGARIIEPYGEASVYLTIQAVMPDGEQLWRSWERLDTRPEEVRPEELLAAAQSIADEIETLAAVEPQRAYFGPVLFEGEAVAGLLGAVLPRALKGTPDLYGSITPGQVGGSTASLRRRLLPPDFAVWDDPRSGEEGWAGHYRFDDEGVPAERVDLVDDGRVVGHLLGRVPSRWAARSNGHGRGSWSGPREGLPGVMHVEGPAKPARALWRRALRAAAAVGEDRVLVVRSLSPVSDMVIQSEVSVPDPASAVFRYADGREEPVRGLTWGDLNRGSLRTTLGVSRERSSWGRASDGVGWTLVGPQQWLIEELELRARRAPDERPPQVPRPGQAVAVTRP